jgi:3-deoxy-D-manno-octulosonic-acid transferase
METFYDLLFSVGLLFTSPFYFWKMWRRGGWQVNFHQRRGIFDTKLKQALTNRQILWMHAVSVGEMNLCIQLVEALQPRLPNLKIVVSTTTTTAMGILQKKLPPEISKIYYPIDRYKYVSRAFQTVHPNAIVLMESEIWPNFMWRARSRRVPVMLVNARLSERSYPRYKRFGFLFKSIFAGLAGVGAQNEEDAVKLRELGCKPANVHVTGSLKFDAARMTDPDSTEIPAILAQFGVNEDTLLLVAGSTHDGEEKILAQQYVRLRKKFPNLFLVIVPRHFERARSVAKDLADCGVTCAYRSKLNPESTSKKQADCLLVDTTGELRHFYKLATLVFIGKSLTAKGGQNPIEPAALGKPVVFGPNMQNFSDITSIYLAKDAMVQVKDAAALETTFDHLLSDADYRLKLGQKALQVTQENRGAMNRTVELIIDQLKDLDIYILPNP